MLATVTKGPSQKLFNKSSDDKLWGKLIKADGGSAEVVSASVVATSAINDDDETPVHNVSVPSYNEDDVVDENSASNNEETTIPSIISLSHQGRITKSKNHTDKRLTIYTKENQAADDNKNPATPITKKTKDDDHDALPVFTPDIDLTKLKNHKSVVIIDEGDERISKCYPKTPIFKSNVSSDHEAKDLPSFSPEPPENVITTDHDSEKSQSYLPELGSYSMGKDGTVQRKVPNTSSIQNPSHKLSLAKSRSKKSLDLENASSHSSSLQKPIPPRMGPPASSSIHRNIERLSPSQNAIDGHSKSEIGQPKPRRKIQMIDGKDVPDSVYQGPNQDFKKELKSKLVIPSNGNSNVCQSSVDAILSSVPNDHENMRQELKIPELLVELLPHQVVGVRWMICRELPGTKGGILADDMGLGKTIQAISLILASKASLIGRHTTLIVTPLSLLKQWKEEMESKVQSKALRVLIHHGPSRSKNNTFNFKDHDVVLTTYDTVASESNFGKKRANSNKAGFDEVSPLFQMQWFRVILDEGHSIKSATAVRSRACCDLQTKRRWILSGTPIQNNIDELQSLLKFLQCTPYNNATQFKKDISEPLKRPPVQVTEDEKQCMTYWDRQKLEAERDRRDAAIMKVQSVLSEIMLRRQKSTYIDGRPLLDLPTRNVKMIKYKFTSDEEKYYQSLEKKAQKTVKRMKNVGEVKYLNILSLLVKLRLACNHPYLVAFEADNSEDALAKELKKDDVEEQTVDELVSMMRDMDVNSNLCTICQEPIEPQSTDKLHCIDCAKTFVSNVRVSHSISKNKKNGAMLFELQKDWFSSTKVDALLAILANLFKEDSSSKTIVFSQFTSFLDIIEIPLVQRGWDFSRYDGSMKLEAREAALQHFKKHSSCKLLLISLGCGSVGLNLTCAQNVIFTEVFWNPYREEQATDRVHRIGQTKDVNVIKMVVTGTVEERIVALQQAKKDLIENAIGGVAQKKMNASRQELAGLIGVDLADLIGQPSMS